MIRVSALYPNSDGSRFDACYYAERHEPFARNLLEPFGLSEIRTTLGLSALDGTPPAFWAISEMVFATRGQFDSAMEHCGERLFADIPNYTDVVPVLQFSELGSDAAP
ncbi:EthD family reductase [Novosphingobium sp. PS1R-30]|uniref:EthD family reductase n=1 Tax=Novosphingobium anseongense TaxID=3133436 RepID=A0ABU8S0W5_9SPHN